MKSVTSMNECSSSSMPEPIKQGSNNDVVTKPTSLLLGLPKPIECKTTTAMMLPTQKLPYNLVDPARHEIDVMKSLFANFTPTTTAEKSGVVDDDDTSLQLPADFNDDLKDFAWTTTATTTTSFQRESCEDNDLSTLDWVSKAVSLPDLTDVLDFYSDKKVSDKPTVGTSIQDLSFKLPTIGGRAHHECLKYQDEIIDIFGQNQAQEGWLTD